jgi:hypothetical protein
MSLNQRRPAPDRLKVLILSCPKTGNTWLRWLIHYAYGLPIAELPRYWNRAQADQLPASFVSHEHLWPNEDLVDWIRENDAVVLSTIRHPGDTLLSYFHFAKWQDLSADKFAAKLQEDGDRPGKRALEFARYSFAQAYAVSLAWARLGACVVRYEDMIVDPVAQLRRIAPLIGTGEERRLAAAALLCKPERMTTLVDPRHIRKARMHGWKKDLHLDIVDAMRGMEPYRSAAGEYGYDWRMADKDPTPFDYASIDPFRGEEHLDNGEPVGPSMPRVYLLEAGDDARERWPDPLVTAGDSFWNWMLAPHPDAARNASLPPGTFTNLMAAVHRMRGDVRKHYPDPAGADRWGYLVWFIGQAPSEFQFPWGLMAPVVELYCDLLRGRVKMASNEGSHVGAGEGGNARAGLA